MNKRNTILLTISLVATSVLSIGGVFALYKREPSDITINISPYLPDRHTVNYYLPTSDGSFTLHSTEEVKDGGTLSSVPSASYTNFTFEKWSTASSLSDTFNTSSSITSDLNLYAAYYGYYVKGSNDASYVQLPSTGGSVSKYKYNGTNDTENFSYSYALIGSDTLSASHSVKIATQALGGSSIAVYKRYRATNTYTSIESKTTNTSNGKYKVYFNPNGSSDNKLYFVRTFIHEIHNYEADVNIHLWNTSNNSITTNWPGIAMTWMGSRDNYYRRYRCFDVDTNRVNKFIIFNSGYDSHRYEMFFGNDTYDSFWSEQYDGSSNGWYSFDLSTQLEN